MAKQDTNENDLHEAAQRGLRTLIAPLEFLLSNYLTDSEQDEWPESPIEKLFLIAFIAKSHVNNMIKPELFDFSTIVCQSGGTMRTADLDVALNAGTRHDYVAVVVPQFRVDQYTADFFIQYRRFDRGHAKIEVGQSANILVECDGHDFHERTKEQARHDKARDRHLVGRGYTVLRFTGSELWKDAVQCVSEVLAVGLNSMTFSEMPVEDFDKSIHAMTSAV